MHSLKKSNPLYLPLKYFQLHNSGNDLLPRAEDFDSYFSESHQPKLLLGSYSKEMIIERLEHYDVLPKLRERGFTDHIIKMDVSTSERNEVQIFDKQEDDNHLIAEIRLHLGDFVSHSRYAGRLRGETCKMLYIQWLLLQNPFKKFTPNRPALPGQKHPGLKMGKEIMRLIVALGEKLGVEGIINVPEFPHAAVLYSRRFNFLNPSSEAILKAFQRDMLGRSLAQGSWGISIGCVRDVDTDKPQKWFQEEQILPISKRWKQHFTHEKYIAKVREGIVKHHFIFDEEKWQRLMPLNSDGSPKAEADWGDKNTLEGLQ